MPGIIFVDLLSLISHHKIIGWLFKKMIAEEKWEEATEIARWQVRNGAHIVDVCLQSSDRDEINDIPLFYEKLIRKADELYREHLRVLKK